MRAAGRSARGSVPTRAPTRGAGLLACLLACLLAGTPLPARAGTPRVLTHDTMGEVTTGPVDGAVRGIAHAGSRAFYVELVRALLAAQGIDAPIVDVPFARGLREVETRPHVVFFNVIRTPDREALARWVGPIVVHHEVLVERAAAHPPVRDLAQARGRRVCVVRDRARAHRLAALGFTHLVAVESYAQCLRLLAAGRVGLVGYARETFDEAALSLDMDPTQFRVTPLALATAEGYIALSRDTPDAEVARWQHALDALKASPAFRVLQRRYASPAAGTTR